SSDLYLIVSIGLLLVTLTVLLVAMIVADGLSKATKTTTTPSHLQYFKQQFTHYETSHRSATGPRWSSALEKSEACGAEQLGTEASHWVAADAQAGLEL